MAEFRQRKFWLLLITILVQLVGLLAILIAWSVRRKKLKNEDDSNCPDEKIESAGIGKFETKANYAVSVQVDFMMKSQEQDDAVILDLGQHGYIQGVKIRDQSTTLAHYFGGIRYALAPSQRWEMAQPLQSDYSYGSETNPARCNGPAVSCPQPFPQDQVYKEDCFQCNIWTPAGQCPDGGWPVYFYIHGGFLQVGSPNDINPSRLLSETNFKCVIVAPVYRLAVLGFLNSNELVQDAATKREPYGNHGFWDQRMALEWTYKYAPYFGGNPSNITVAGYSAGSYSVFHQLAHDLYLPQDKSIIRQAIMFSNGPGVQPKGLSEVQKQFDELLTALSIPLNISSSEKLARLRGVPTRELIAASVETKYHQYRPWHDGAFIPKTLFPDIDNGSFARRMAERNVRLMNGECRDEHFIYGIWFTPDDSLQALRRRLEADYPQEACDALINFYYPDEKLPPDCEDWKDAFGRIYADVQVHMVERGLMSALARGGAAHLVYRYRIEFRVKCVDLPPEWGVTHSSDMAMWFWGNGAQLEQEEKLLVNEALIEPLVDFVNGSDVVRWDGADPSNKSIQRVRRLRSDGQVDIWHDDGEMWLRGLKVWNALRQIRSAPQGTSKL